MQATFARHRFERRLFIFGVLWLLGGAAAYLLTRQPGALWFLPPTLQLRLAPIPLQQTSDTFPTFASIIALSLLCVWLLGCGRRGAVVICGGWMMLGVGYEFGQRTDLGSWITANLPTFFHYVWPFTRVERMFGSGGFNMNLVAATIMGSLIAYVIVLNSIPNRYRG